VINKHLFILLACLFVVMIGLGITQPVLPFYVERLALGGGASRQAVAMHIGLITGVFALGQLLFAPVWGRWSDRTGRRPLLLIGIAGYAVAQILFGLATSLWLLYAARVLGGILSSAALPVAAAYVADMTTEQDRGRGMAWLGTATSLGFVVGPGLGGVLARRDLHFSGRFWCFVLDSFSIPFLAAALLALLALLAAMRWLPESLTAHAPKATGQYTDWRSLALSLAPFLGMAFVAQFALAIFESTFALYAQAKLKYGPVEVGAVFIVCGLVMTVFQIGAVGFLAGRIREIIQIAAGFGLIGASLALLVVAHTKLSVFAVVGLIAFGTSIISPNLAALISKRGGTRHVGTALGTQSAANSLGQTGGPIIGGALFAWQMNAPYLLTAALLVMVALAIALKAWYDRTQPALSDSAVPAVPRPRPETTGG
jgi:DHA1 family multidrug resistance protein-like MFS transporter